MLRCLVAFGSLLVSTGCLATWNGVVFEPSPEAPVVVPRAEGCAVDVVADGDTPTRPFRQIGTVRLRWSPEQMRLQGYDGAVKSLKVEACERGAHLIVGLRALPMTPHPGSLFDADFAVWLDENGQPLQPRSMAEANAAAAAAAKTPAVPVTASP
jgi:hypothetical protein